MRAICEDRDGDLWLGTFGGGFIRLRVRREQVFDARVGLPDETASCISIDSTGKLWAGFQSGGLFDGTGRRFDRTGNLRLISLPLPRARWQHVGRHAWHGLYRFAGAQEIHFGTAIGLSSDFITAVAAQADGAIVIGTSAGVVHRLRGDQLESYGKDAGLSGQPISALAVGPRGHICAGTAAGEIFYEAERSFKRADADALMGAAITALKDDGDGRFWLGTAGHGLACLQNNQISVWTVKSGLPDDNVFGIWPQTNGVVWAATGKGIFSLENRVPEGAATGFVVARLVVESEKTERQAWGFPLAAESSDGRLWFAMPGHVVSIDPDKVVSGPSALPVYIEKVLANDIPLPMPRDGQPLRLPPRLTSLEFHFAALNLAEPEKVDFQHKLDGFDNDWAGDGAERRIRYGRLPYGNYTFHVRARNVDGLWSEAQSPLEFIYPAPPWQSPAALAIYYGIATVGLVVLVVWVISHRRLRVKIENMGRQQAMQKERMRIAQDMHDEVGSKLTKIAYLSEIMSLRIKGPEVEALNSIASTSRDLLQSLDEIVWAVNPRNDSLERLAAYLGHFAAEYFQETPVELEVDLPTGLPDHPLSAEIRHNLFLAFEESLGNALKHSGATKVHVTMSAAELRFTIRVQDNGRGFQPDQSMTPRNGGGNGLGNMR